MLHIVSGDIPVDRSWNRSYVMKHVNVPNITRANACALLERSRLTSVVSSSRRFILIRALWLRSLASREGAPLLSRRSAGGSVTGPVERGWNDCHVGVWASLNSGAPLMV